MQKSKPNKVTHTHTVFSITTTILSIHNHVSSVQSVCLCAVVSCKLCSYSDGMISLVLYFHSPFPAHTYMQLWSYQAILRVALAQILPNMSNHTRPTNTSRAWRMDRHNPPDKVATQLYKWVPWITPTSIPPSSAATRVAEDLPQLKQRRAATGMRQAQSRRDWLLQTETHTLILTLDRGHFMPTLR